MVLARISTWETIDSFIQEFPGPDIFQTGGELQVIVNINDYEE